jgi:hypothetical protein
MKNIIKFFSSITLLVVLFAACEKKVDDLPHYEKGTAPVLSSTATTIAPVTADSLKPVVIFSWSNPNYATDSAGVKYIIEIDSSGRNFSKAVTTVVTGKLNATFLAKDINNILLGFGFNYNTPYDVDVRLTSSYPNNNEQYKSNVLKIRMTPYVVPPKVVPPSSKALFLVGNATAGGWGNPVPATAQQFTKVDSVTYQGTFYLNGGGQYVMLPVNGDWAHKFNVADASVANLSTGGDFGFDLGNANIPGPAATGMYTIRVDFQRGKFTVVPVKLYSLLYVPGDYQTWKPETAPALGSPNADGSFDGYVNIPAGNTLEFKLNTTPDWSNSYGDGGGGTLVLGGGGNLKVPSAGYYHITANTTTKTWAVAKTTWSLIGSFPASNWNNDIDMTYSVANNNWTATITTIAGDQFKFRANHDWGLNYGETGGKGSLAAGGDNLGDPAKNFAVPAGTHKVTLFLNNSGYFTYMIE